MKKTIKIMSVAVAFVFLAGVALAGYQNEPEGFRGLNWGIKIDNVVGMVPLDKDEETSFYMRKGDKMKLGGSTLSLIAYRFWKKNFSGVAITINGLSNWEALKKVAFAKFGDGTKKNPFIEKYTWVGATTYIVLRYDQFTKTGMLILSSTRLIIEEREYNKTKAEKGAEEDF